MPYTRGGLTLPPNNMKKHARTNFLRLLLQLKLTALLSRPGRLPLGQSVWRAGGGGACSQVKDCAIGNRTVGARRSPNQTDGDNDDGWVLYYCVPAETETETVVCGGQRPGLAPTTWIDPPTPGRCRGRCFITPNCLLVLLRVRIHGLIKLTMADPRRCINCRCASDRAASANTTAGTILVYSRCY